MWPTDAASLVARQEELADAVGATWRSPGDGLLLGGCWVCFARGASGTGAAGDPAWASAVAAWLRTRGGTRPLVVHPGWATDLGTAVGLVLGATARRRTPEPLRRARQAAREARAGRS